MVCGAALAAETVCERHPDEHDAAWPIAVDCAQRRVLAPVTVHRLLVTPRTSGAEGSLPRLTRASARSMWLPSNRPTPSSVRERCAGPVRDHIPPLLERGMGVHVAGDPATAWVGISGSGRRACPHIFLSHSATGASSAGRGCVDRERVRSVCLGVCRRAERPPLARILEGYRDQGSVLASETLTNHLEWCRAEEP